MMTMRMLLRVAMLLLSASVQAFPDRPVTILMPFPAGTTTDINSRDFAQLFSTVIRQPVLVDNRVGAEGVIAGQALINANPDGHTLMYTSSSLPVLDPVMKKSMPYDPQKDFAPLCAVGRTSNVMNVTGSSRYRTAGEVVAAARASPGKLRYAYTSATTRLAAELFAQSSGITLGGIPYKSSTTALVEVSNGLVDLMFIDHLSSMPMLQGGRNRALTVAGAERITALPDVPSAVEAGVPGYDMKVWFGVFGTAKSSPAVLAKVREAVEQTLKLPEMATILEKRGLTAMPICGDALAKFQADEIGIYRRVVKNAGIELQ